MIHSFRVFTSRTGAHAGVRTSTNREARVPIERIDSAVETTPTGIVTAIETTLLLAWSPSVDRLVSSLPLDIYISMVDTSSFRPSFRVDHSKNTGTGTPVSVGSDADTSGTVYLEPGTTENVGDNF